MASPILLKFRKLLFLATPKAWRSPFCTDNPFLSGHDIGEWTYGPLRVLSWEGKAKLHVGRFCSIGGGVTVFLDGQHRMDWITTYPMRLVMGPASPAGQVAGKGDVRIGHDVWIGDGATILSGVSIGNGAVIGARAVVARDVPPYGVVVGNPGRLVRKRFTEAQIEALERIAWWDWPIDKVKSHLPQICSPRIDDFIQQHAAPEL